MGIPTKWATIEVGWGSDKAHLYSTSDMVEIEYHKTEEAARKKVATLIRDGEAKMVAIMEIKSIFEAEIAAKEVA